MITATSMFIVIKLIYQEPKEIRKKLTECVFKEAPTLKRLNKCKKRLSK